MIRNQFLNTLEFCINLEANPADFAEIGINEKVVAPKIWKETYLNSDYELITKDNFLDFLIWNLTFLKQLVI